VFSNETVEDGSPFGQPLQRADLVRAHETTVAGFAQGEVRELAD